MMMILSIPQYAVCVSTVQASAPPPPPPPPPDDLINEENLAQWVEDAWNGKLTREELELLFQYWDEHNLNWYDMHPPDPPPLPPISPEYTPPPMTEEWQLEIDWTNWYWMNMAQDYMNHRLTPEQEQILLNYAHAVCERSNTNTMTWCEAAIIQSLVHNLQHPYDYSLGVVMR